MPRTVDRLALYRLARKRLKWWQIFTSGLRIYFATGVYSYWKCLRERGRVARINKPKRKA
jgi:N-glycosylase/DNA lyase